MKKQLLVSILCFLTFGLFAQVANQPTDYNLCDDGFNSEIAEFNLIIKDAEILQGQDPVTFSVSYYLSQQDADNGINSLSSPFTNFTNPQTIFATVTDNVTGNFDTTTLDLIVIQATDAGSDGYLEICNNESPIDLFYVLGGSPQLGGTWLPGLASGTGIFSPNIDASGIYTYTVQGGGSCPSSSSTVSVSVLQGPSVNQQTVLYACSFDGSGFAQFDLSQATPLIIGSQTDVTVSYYETQADADNNVNPLNAISPYANIIPNYQILYVRVESTTSDCVEMAFLNLIVSGVAPLPTISDYIVCDEDQDGFAEFNLQTKNNEVLVNQYNFELFVTYHSSESDAQSQINALPDLYTNTSNPETIYVAVSDYYGCNIEVQSFNLVADVNCMPCQDIGLTIDSTLPGINNSGIIVAQINDNINFIGNAVFSNDGTDATYSWDFGDNNMASGLSVVHSYSQTGNYTATLTVTDNNPEGCTASISIEVIILGEFLSVDQSQFTVEELIQNVLINNECSQISNIIYSTGSTFSTVEPNGIGYFVYAGDDFPFSEGLLLSTGEAADVAGPNDSNISSGSNGWPGDVDLDTTLEVQSNNATTIEFDFVPVVNQINFEFLMASEEYNGGDFECQFSDAFAFLLTDPMGNTTNLALIPGTELPITVTNIHNANSSCDAANPEFFAGYTFENSPPFRFNGRTVSFTAQAEVNIGETYHIKLVIADDVDSGYDSAVFFKAGSFDIGSLCEDTGLISLKAFNDTNTNGNLDSGESNFTNGTFTYEKNNDGIINVVNSSNGSFTILSTDESDTYDITFTVNSDFTNCYTQNVTLFNDVNVVFGELAQIEFPVEDNLICEDLAVHLINSFESPRPGFEYSNALVIENLSGANIASGSVDFALDEDLLINSTVLTDPSITVTMTTSGFTLNFINLGAGESETVLINLLCPATVALGELVTNTATYTTVSNDMLSANNQSSLSEIVIGSYDPNDKMESHGKDILYDDFAASDEYLYYTIRFQNVGTAEAINVRIEDVLDTQLDASTFQMLRSSHDYVVTRTANNLEWNFDNINLPAEQNDAEGSNGFVYFKIKPNAGYAIGDVIENSASIYFDFNAPIITNTFQTEFIETLSVNGFDSNSFSLFPNPAKEKVTIQLASSNFETGSVNIYNIQGKIILNDIKLETNASTIDISSLESGLYFVELTIGNTATVQKLIVN
ncbi:DUF7619 domain-containing protein [Winogradskyella ludwigii]|uniref:DUF7619 domain-containing protein n=1 Tax=Winogradskyella ludwigii TaxID=2686076 RepID=UPI0015C9EBD7|nr:choice-of-anchor L domain-containing protein [Winogradskyella ludwigii]